MFNFQSYIKSIRESKDLEQNTVANATNLSIETIKLIEDADSKSLLETSSTLLKNQIRRYCEYLEVKENKIISILNKLDILYYKKSSYGKLKVFDYFNRLAILVLIVAISVLGYQHIEKNIFSASSISNPQNSKTSIIYTPVNYDVDDLNNQSNPSMNSSNVAQKTAKPKTADSTSDTTSKTISTTVAHPPMTANMNNIVIDDPDSKSVDFNS
ncbi:helix-turn-helix domain-containing protein [Francisella adeliensis]|uniref:DNA-binding protein n=1 Tax=Francisella adeliensis TaxID=2007306 RepID=A0A2Z4XZ30_9GAMM|nr:helix-turn-helix domain-containing protein [Francisella adeliensis]AXA34127.1 DNA-binding protein [Francisella adeliensis]MBK2085295.1 helix-turn-helix domain-containing protein [Francisella adeliensis]MBK2095937.1 helix-turn-helix domain-containing protein [Francisella adeliensis]QIW12369.1 DNA-binding protein [Francisella adeliensis]QIW14243.1 DNA-binding protein [Francisella adeliensis]